jgi:Putative TM nitroreductase
MFMNFSSSILDIIPRRFSCRAYSRTPMEEQKRETLRREMSRITSGPLGTPLRCELVASADTGANPLQGLGTYGFIKNPDAFIVAAVSEGPKDLEDFGYALERMVLLATDLGCGSCWLGGSFTKSSFAGKIGSQKNETVPAVVSLGNMEDPERERKRAFRRIVGSATRLPWEKLFFDQSFDSPLSRDSAGAYAAPLEMVRLGPSASNKQPWRIVKDGNDWHFFMRRTRGYRDGIASRLLGIADIQRVDMGIAMCHFELSSRELGLNGGWRVHEPSAAAKMPGDSTEYTVSWAG